MHTELGEGECRIGSFSVDFHEDQMYLAGQAYPKGYFANEILNIGGKKVAQLLRCAVIAGGPRFHQSHRQQALFSSAPMYFPSG